MRRDSVRINKLYLRDYGIFAGINELVFDRHRTLIVGQGGTGKTTIFNALANMGPAVRIKPNARVESPQMSIDVVTSGNRVLLNDHRDIIFLRCESVETLAFKKKSFINNFDDHMVKTLDDETQAIFHNILHHKPHKIRVHHNLNPKLMAAGERFCLGLSLVFAVRKSTNLALPVVMESPYGWIDAEARKGLSEFLKRETCQQILLGSEEEFREVENKPDYLLDYANGSSRVVYLPSRQLIWYD
jgi:hypothetical protein